jgi:hypothetical protein
MSIKLFDDERQAMEAQSKWLRQVADEIARAGHYGWGNTCTQAADVFDQVLRRAAESGK